jgi:hypothetical protein
VVDFQNRAIHIHEWDQRVIPGPVQTEDYARAVIRAGQPYLSADEVERKVAARMDRQQIFHNGGGMIVEAPDQVASLMTTMNLIRAAALSPRESQNLLRKIRDEIA